MSDGPEVNGNPALPKPKGNVVRNSQAAEVIAWLHN